MGCFLACFGLKKTKRRIQPSKTRPDGGRSLRSYVLLDSVDGSVLISESDQEHKEKQQKVVAGKIKKKVRFNLNVEAYEPINSEDDSSSAVHLFEGHEEAKWEFNTETESMAGYYPESYRYKNCRNSYDDEEDEFIFDDLELEDSDEEELDELCSNGNEYGRMLSGEDFCRPLNPGTGETDNVLIKNWIHDLPNQKMNPRTRDRSHYVLSVLNPVANLDQWREVKAKPVEQQLKQQKENILPQQDGSSFKKMMSPDGSQCPKLTAPVHASLSDWLSSMDNMPTIHKKYNGQNE